MTSSDTAPQSDAATTPTRQHEHSIVFLNERHQQFQPILQQCCAAPIVAPMVGISHLPFRMLCRSYHTGGPLVVYTEMIDARQFVGDDNYRALKLATHANDRPLIVQLAANNAEDFIAAAAIVASQCDGVCLNLGCPLRHARTHRYGAYLFDNDTEPRSRLLSMLHTITQSPTFQSLPLFAKIRLLDDRAETMALCRQLAMAGVSLIAIHGRTRGSVSQRRDGPADLATIKLTKAHLSSLSLPVMVVTNGNVRRASDIDRNLRLTGCDGIMLAESVMCDPSIIQQHQSHTVSDSWSVAMKFLSLIEVYGLPAVMPVSEQLAVVVHQCQHFIGAQLRHYQLDVALLECDNMSSIRAIVSEGQRRQQLECSGQWKADIVMQLYLDDKRKELQRQRDRERGRKRLHTSASVTASTSDHHEGSQSVKQCKR